MLASRAPVRPLVARLSATLILVLAASCASMGPKTIPTDQFNYNAAIASSSNEQLLLNIVRLRYSEAPVFLKISSVINQYARIAGISASAGNNTGVTGEDVVGVLGGQATWADRPTITYAPLSGKEFATSLLTPVSPEALFRLVQSGWPPELVLRVAVMSINGLENEVARPARRREADPGFLELLELWGRLRAERALGISEKDEKGVFLFFPKVALGEAARSDLARFRELLGLDPGIEKLRLITGFIPEKPDEIAVLTGSIWDVMVSLAWSFDVPPEHVEQGRTAESFQAARPAPPQIQVKFDHGARPADAHVAVFSRGYWFYIDDRDRDSKRAFSFLHLLLSLAETGTAASGPVVTISN